MFSNSVSCQNCQAVTTKDGRTVWVCESCGEENKASTGDTGAAQAALDSAVVITETPAAVAPSLPTDNNPVVK